MRQINQPDEISNDFYYCYDYFGTLVALWMDNRLVFCVSTVYKASEIVVKLRKKPRKIVENKDHVDIVWKEKSTAEFFTPTLIDNYNHWMYGVDISDQRIAYYHPNLRCIQNWIPIFIQILRIVRNN